MPAPVVTTPVPAPGVALAGQDAITLSVTSGTGLLRVFVVVRYPGIGTTELIHDGTAYTAQYSPTSSRSAIAGGFTYSLQRSPLWPDAPTISIYAEDTGGLETIAVFVWPLSAPPPLVDPGSLVPTFPLGSTASQAQVTEHDQTYFLKVFDRILSADWLAPLKSIPNAGYELLQAYALLGARISTAIARLERGSIIVFASGGAFSTVTVEFLRPDASHGAVTIAAGTVVTTSRGGRDFVTTQDALFGAMDVGPIAVSAVAVAPGWQWNVPGKTITPRGESFAGEIDTIRAQTQLDPAVPFRSATFIDPTISVQQIVDAQGGADPMLDGLGADRGMARASGETDPHYRLRMRQLPDTVSPAAILRNAHGLLDPLRIPFDFEETWSTRYQTCWDSPSSNNGTPTYQPIPPEDLVGFSEDTFCYDDPRPAYDPNDPHRPAGSYPFFNRWLDSVEFRGAFIIVVPLLPAIADCGMAYDDTAAVPSDFVTALGRRAYGAYDVPITFPDAIGLQGGYDGFDPGTQAIYLGLFNMLQQVKAAGVAALVEQQGQ